MRKLTIVVIKFIFIALLISSNVAFSFPAFPGAEGFGSNSIGGRGGQVIKVTNLNDSGLGSLRAAVTTLGSRIIIFEVSGIINLKSGLDITKPYLTIAGETSPGGILITGYTTMLNTHDVIIRHLRFRVGSHRVTDGSNADPETLDSFTIWGNTIPGGGGNDAYNIIIDHCSFGWGVDETFSTSYNARDITVQWSIVSEGLSHAGHPKGEHSKGILFSGKWSPDTKVSLHHSYIAHNRDRNPLVSGPEPVFADIRNNVIYNWYHALSVGFQENGRGNLVNNYMKPGLDGSSNSFEAYVVEPLSKIDNIIYTNGNMGVTRLTQTAPQWMVAHKWLGV
jgi:pectate lyase